MCQGIFINSSMTEPYSNDKLDEVESQGYVTQAEGTACVQKTYFFLKK